MDLSLRCAVAFLVCWSGSLVSLLLKAPLAAVGFAAFAFVFWFIGMRADVRKGRARLKAQPTTSAGLDRRRVGRSLLLSWLVPGLGDLYLGFPGRRAVALITAYFTIAIPVWVKIVPAAVGIPFVLLIWVWGQDELRRQTHWGWWPLMPSWGELLPDKHSR